jgi:hypothetical protein
MGLNFRHYRRINKGLNLSLKACAQEVLLLKPLELFLLVVMNMKNKNEKSFSEVVDKCSAL